MGASYPFSFRNKSIGEKIFGFNIFRAVSVPIAGVEPPGPMHSPVVSTPGWGRDGFAQKKSGTQHPCFAPPMYGKIYKYSYSSMLQFSAAKRL